MCRKPSNKIRRAVGRGKGFSRLRGLNESLLKPIWERFPTDKWAHKLVPGAQITRFSVALDAYAGRPLRLAFLSDLHAGPTTPNSTLQAAFDFVHEVRPDAVLLGGDYVYFDADNVQRMREPLVRMAEKYPTWGVWGNHDLWADDEYLARFFAGAGVRMLCNEWQRGLLGEPLHLYGVDDPWTGQPDFSPLTSETAEPVLLLCHNPDGILLMDASHHADVMLCGHTHGGQVCRPDGSPYMVHARTGTRFAAGLFEHEGRRIVVSKGIGTVEIPWRRYAPPEVLVLDLLPAGVKSAWEPATAGAPRSIAPAKLVR